MSLHIFGPCFSTSLSLSISSSGQTGKKESPSLEMATKYEGWKKRHRGGIHKSLFDEILVLLLHFIQSGGNVSLLQHLLF